MPQDPEMAVCAQCTAHVRIQIQNRILRGHLDERNFFKLDLSEWITITIILKFYVGTIYILQVESNNTAILIKIRLIFTCNIY